MDDDANYRGEQKGRNISTGTRGTENANMRVPKRQIDGTGVKMGDES